MDVDATASASIPNNNNKAPKKEAARLAADAANLRTLPNGLVRTLVLSYLLRNCYRETALAFVAADETADYPTDAMHDNATAPSGLPPRLTSRELDHLEKRRSMMNLVLTGDVLAAIELADSLLSTSHTGNTVQTLFPTVYFHLLSQHFVELVRSRNTIDALAFAQKSIAPLCREHSDFTKPFQEYLPLLAYPEPELSPLFNLLDERCRATVAEELNDHVFSYLIDSKCTQLCKVERQSELERIMRHLSLLMTKLSDKDDSSKWTLAEALADHPSEEE